MASMRTYGEIDNVEFKRQGYDIYNLAIKYKLISYQGISFVYVNTMTELKKEISKLNGGIYEEDEV